MSWRCKRSKAFRHVKYPLLTFVQSLGIKLQDAISNAVRALHIKQNEVKETLTCKIKYSQQQNLIVRAQTIHSQSTFSETSLATLSSLLNIKVSHSFLLNTHTWQHWFHNTWFVEVVNRRAEDKLQK